MASSLRTGVSGLVAHQQMLDIIGNNLANLNTTAYKAQRVIFSDLLYTTLRPARSSVNTDFGGINPIQVGSGVKMAQVDRRFTQGNLDPTSGLLDFSIQGDGFFVASDGSTNLYTRAGAFVLDESGKLVDATNGYAVLRVGTVGETDGVNPGFQEAGDATISIPFGTSIAGEGTTQVELSGNLTADATGPRAEVITSSSPYQESGAPATAATLLNNLDSSTAPFIVGDTVSIAGTDFDGSSVSATLNVDGTTTLGDLMAAIDAAFAGASSSIDVLGNLVLTADTIGETAMTLSLGNGVANTGGINFATHLPVTTTEGKVGDVIQSALEIFDIRGGSHTVNLTFQKNASDSWDLTASIDAKEGIMLDDSVQQITFNDDGSLRQVLGTGLGDAAITIQFNGITTPQTIAISFGANGTFEGLTHVAADSSMAAKQNGFAPGSLSSVNVSSDGIIEGVATNGRTFPIAQLAIASFRNSKGLTARGDNFFLESLNSGEVQIGTALSGNRGQVLGGHLEQANVDIALEFTRLIVAQRGFSANARTITVTDEILEELTNLIR